MVCVAVAFAAPAFAQSNGTPSQIPSKAPVGPTFGGCTTGHVYAKADSATGVGTSSETFVDVPNMSVSFKIGGTVPSCVIVSFSAYSFARLVDDVNQLLMVQATLDGTALPPGEVQLSGDDDEDNDGEFARQHSMQWAGPVNPGPHTVTIQFRSLFGASVFVHAPTMTVFTK
jgi:hypothetical protein